MVGRFTGSGFKHLCMSFQKSSGLSTSFGRSGDFLAGVSGMATWCFLMECLVNVCLGWIYSETPIGTPLPVHTSAATIANMKTSTSCVTVPPFKIPGAVHAVATAGLGPWGRVSELFPPIMDVKPKSVRRAWPSLSIRMFAFAFIGIID